MPNSGNQCVLLSNKKPHLYLVNKVLSSKKISCLHMPSEKELPRVLTAQKVALMFWDIDIFNNISDTLKKDVKKHAIGAIHIIIADRRKIRKINRDDTGISIYTIFDMLQGEDALAHIVTEGIEKYKIIKENRALRLLMVEKDKKMKEVNAHITKKISSLNSSFEEKHKTLRRRNHRLKRGIRSIVEVFSSLTDIRNGHPNHCRNVAYLCRLTAEAMSLKDEEINTIEVAALLHDIGKVAIDESIVKKAQNNRNTLEEKHYRMHPLRGQAAIDCIEGFKEVGKIIRHHHENYDGSGYPDKLKGKDIPLGSRIIAVADRIDNVANSLKRWDKYSLQRALWSVELGHGSIYDPDVYKIMASVINQWLKTLMSRGKDDMTLYFIDGFLDNSAMSDEGKTQDHRFNVLRYADIEQTERSRRSKVSPVL